MSLSLHSCGSGRFASLGATSAFGLFNANAYARKAALFQQAFKCKAAQ